MTKPSINLQEELEANSKIIERAADRVIEKYSEELDDYMKIIDEQLRQDRGISDEALDDFAMNLSSILYFASSGCEDLAIRDDMSKAMYKEAYNTIRTNLQTGTVADKNSEAELATTEERLNTVIYAKAYKKLKAKVEAAQEMRSTVKKVLSRRIAELELERESVQRREHGDGKRKIR